MVKKLSALFVGAMALSFTPRSFSQVFSAEDFWAFGVEGSNLYGFTDPTTRITITTSLTAAPDFYGANHLATDADNNRVIYALSNYSSGYSVAGFYAWDLTTNTRIDITNGIDLGLIGVSWGGGSFYNGDYYFWDDEWDSPTVQTGVVKISFNDQGLISSVTRPWGFMDAGELGDIAIDANGTMYIITTEQAGFQFYRLDLNNPAAQLQLIGNYASTLTGAPQLFIDDQGRLIANHTVTGDWYSLNPNAGGVLEMITGPGFGLEYNDLAEGGVVGTVPEPGSLLLMGIAGALGCLRRKRCA